PGAHPGRVGAGARHDVRPRLGRGPPAPAGRGRHGRVLLCRPGEGRLTPRGARVGVQDRLAPVPVPVPCPGFPMPQPADAPWLSVLVPVYNVERYVRACLDSVLGQADAGVELLVLDDASPDAAMAVVADLQRAHPGRIRTLAHARNRGLSAARNSLAEAARGRYLWFLDSDDVLLPGAIAGLREVVEREAPDLVLCDFRLLREDGTPYGPLRGRARRSGFGGRAGDGGSDRDALLAGLLEGRQLHAWSKIAVREAWQAARFPEGRYFEDMAVVAPQCAQVARWRHVPRAWVGYRQRGDSIMARMTPDKSRDL